MDDPYDVYKDYLNRLAPGQPRCDCDFHKGRWAYSKPGPSKYGGSAKYAIPGSDVVMGPNGYCNLPQPTGLSAWLPSGTLFGIDRHKWEDAAAGLAAKAATTKTGFYCNRCKEYNEYAASNQTNGTYVCFNCRT